MKTLDKVLLGLAVFLLAFIIANMIIFCIKDAIPDALVTCVCGSTAIEIIVTAWITTTKEKRRNKTE